MDRKHNTIDNIAHRGARSLAPENTLVAARKALEVGADFWETDVAVTRDEVLILFHDDSLARTTDVEFRFPDRYPWTFTNFSFSEIQSLDAGTWYVDTDPFGQIAAEAVTATEQSTYKGEKVPSLREAFIFTKEADWRVNLELKRLPPPMDCFPVVDRVLSLIDYLGIDTRHFIISSFNHAWLHEIQAHDLDIAVQALIGYSETDPLDWGKLEFKTYNARATLTDAEQIRALNDRKKNVNLYIVNEKEEMVRFIAEGVAGLITDFPQTLAEIIRKAGHQ